MDTIHTQKIYPLRDLLQQIRDYFNAGNKNNQLKLSIQKKIADTIAEGPATDRTIEEGNKTILTIPNNIKK